MKNEKYIITGNYIGCKDEIEITKDDYDAIVSARKMLTEVTLIEEKFTGICAHYCEIQRFLFDASLNNMMYGLKAVPAIHSIGAEFGRLLSSFLSSVRLYTDSSLSVVPKITKGRIGNEGVKKFFSHEFDNNYSFRAMEAIRNYSQHSSSPVHSAKYNSYWKDDSIIFESHFFFTSSRIEDRSKFKVTVLREIEENGGRFDLKEGLRSYFASVCNVHEKFREESKPERLAYNETIKRWQEAWTAKFGDEKLIGVVACKTKGGLVDDDSYLAYISIQSDEYRTSLEEKVTSLRNMEKKHAVP